MFKSVQISVIAVSVLLATLLLSSCGANYSAAPSVSSSGAESASNAGTLGQSGSNSSSANASLKDQGSTGAGDAAGNTLGNAGSSDSTSGSGEGGSASNDSAETQAEYLAAISQPYVYTGTVGKYTGQETYALNRDQMGWSDYFASEEYILLVFDKPTMVTATKSGGGGIDERESDFIALATGSTSYSSGSLDASVWSNYLGKQVSVYVDPQNIYFPSDATAKLLNPSIADSYTIIAVDGKLV